VSPFREPVKPRVRLGDGDALYRKVCDDAEHLRTHYPEGCPRSTIGRCDYDAAVLDLLQAWEALDLHLRGAGDRPHAWDGSVPCAALPLLAAR